MKNLITLLLISLVFQLNAKDVDFNKLVFNKEIYSLNGQPFTGKAIRLISKEKSIYLSYDLVDGKLNGEKKLITGSIVMALSFMKDNKVHGQHVKFWGAGRIQSFEHWENGERQGPSFEYYSTGQIESKSFYLNNLLNGEQIVYSKSGKILAIRSYKNGKHHGRSSFYKEDGALIDETVHTNGELIERFTYKNGQKIKVGFDEEEPTEIEPNAEGEISDGFGDE